MGIAHRIAEKLTKYPVVKRTIKDVYAITGNILSDKRTDIEGIKRD